MSLYTATLDGLALLDPRDENLLLETPVLTQEDNMAAAFSFLIRPDHVRYNDLEILSSRVTVFRDGVNIFYGRPISVERRWDNQKMVTCESSMAFLSDSIIEPYTFQGTIPDYIDLLLTQHNTQVDDSRKIERGTVTVTDPNDYITRAASARPTTREEIKTKLTDLLGGHLIIRYASGTAYLDYLADSPYMSQQEIEFGENLLDFVEKVDGAEIYTAILPMGGKIENEDEEEVRITIESVNGGINYVQSDVHVQKYGLIKKVMTWDDVTLPENLKAKALEELPSVVTGMTNLQITAFDLSRIPGAPDMDTFRFLEYVQVRSAYHNIDTQMMVVRMSTDLLDPAANQLTLGRDMKGLSSYIASQNDRLISIESDYVVNQRITDMVNDIQSVYTAIYQEGDRIKTEVGQSFVSQNEYQIYQQEMSTMLEQTSNQFIFWFNNLEEQLSNLDGVTQDNFNEWRRYIRMEDGALWFGEVGNEMMLKEIYDRISFMRSLVEVAYFSGSELGVNKVNVFNSLKIGVFTFFPRDNGNLSLILTG